MEYGGSGLHSTLSETTITFCVWVLIMKLIKSLFMLEGHDKKLVLVG